MRVSRPAIARSAPTVLLSLAVAVAVLVAAAAPAAADSIVNGSFENSTAGLPDSWNPTGNMTVVSTQGETDGTYALAFSYGNVASTGVISQTFATVAGTQYVLTFDFGKYSITQPTQVARLDVDAFDGTGFSGTQILDATVSDGTPGTGDADSTDSPSVYSSYQYLFTANGLWTTLRFTDTSDAQSGPGGFDAMLDNVHVSPVPEPGTLALLALGLGGWSARRRWLRAA